MQVAFGPESFRGKSGIEQCPTVLAVQFVHDHYMRGPVFLNKCFDDFFHDWLDLSVAIESRKIMANARHPQQNVRRCASSTMKSEVSSRTTSEMSFWLDVIRAPLMD